MPSLPTYIFSQNRKKAPHIQISHNNCFKDTERNKRLAADSIIMCPQIENSQYIYCSCFNPYLGVHNDKWKAQAGTDNSLNVNAHMQIPAWWRENLQGTKNSKGFQPTSGLHQDEKPTAPGVLGQFARLLPKSIQHAEAAATSWGSTELQRIEVHLETWAMSEKSQREKCCMLRKPYNEKFWKINNKKKISTRDSLGKNQTNKTFLERERGIEMSSELPARFHLCCYRSFGAKQSFPPKASR